MNAWHLVSRCSIVRRLMSLARVLAWLLAASAGAAHAQDSAPGNIVRDCSVTDRLSLQWQPGSDTRAIRFDVFSRTERGAPAEWHGWTAFGSNPRYTFDDNRLAGREFRIALKDGTSGPLRDWSNWQRPACANGATPAAAVASTADGSGNRDSGDRSYADRCAADGSTRLSWGAVAGTREYNLFRQDDGGNEWLRSVPGNQPRTTFRPGAITENDRIQIDVLFEDGSRRYGHTFSRGCAVRPSGASASPSASVSAGAAADQSTPATQNTGDDRDARIATDRTGLPPGLAGSPDDWTRHPWSHDFNVASDLDRWHAPHRLGGRDPDDRHVGKQRKQVVNGPLLDNSNHFSEVARVDTERGHLVMRSLFSEREEFDSRGLGRGEARMPFLVSAAGFDVLDDNGRRLDWTQRYPFGCTPGGSTTVNTPCDFVIDPREKDWYIEIRANFEGATDAFKTWWAFWLYPRNRAYDGNVDTGMEVDVLEYVPYVSPDGFHAALFRRRDETLRPEGRSFTARNTDAYLRRANADYDACRRLETCPPIRLDEGFHTIGIEYSRSRYAFYLDGYRFWQVDDPSWITKTQKLALRLTWEKDEGGVIDDTDGNGVLDFLDDGVGGAPRDGIPDWRQAPQRTNLSYGPWGQGFSTKTMYDRECRVRVVSGPKLSSFIGGEYPFDVARGRYGIAASDLEIVEGSCSLRRYSTSHPPSEVRIDYVHAYTRRP